MEKGNSLISAIVLIALGILLCIFRTAVIGWCIFGLGVILVILAIFDLIASNLTAAIIRGLIGALAIVLKFVIKDAIIIVFAILLILYGIAALLSALKANKPQGIWNIITIFIAPVVTIVLGFLTLFGNLADIVFLIEGILLIVDGSLGILGALLSKN